MSDHTEPIRFRLDGTPPQSVRDALEQLATAVDTEEDAQGDDVEGFRFDPRASMKPRFPKTGPIIKGPEPDSFCLGLEVDLETGDSSCTIMWT